MTNFTKRGEMAAAEQAVPAIFTSLWAKHEDVGITQLELSAAMLFRALWCVGDNVISYIDLLDEVEQAYWYMVSRNRDEYNKGIKPYTNFNPVKMLIELKLIDMIGDVCFVSDKFIDLCFNRTGAAPLTEGQERRVSYVKNQMKPSQLLKESCDFEMTTGFNVHFYMKDIINRVIDVVPDYNWHDFRSVLEGSKTMTEGEVYFSEIDADTRGRKYFVSHRCPNPQKSGIDRSLFALADGVVVTKGSKMHDALIYEFMDIIKDDKMAQDNIIEYVARHPETSLAKLLKQEMNNDCLVKDAFQYVRMCLDLHDINSKGEVYCSMPIGYDAKCSGTQYLAICAGDMRMLKATGFTDVKVRDPYQMCADLWKGMEREIIKKPYMVVQYGGGKRAILKERELMNVLLQKLPLYAGDEDKIAQQLIDTVNEVLGPRITSWKEIVSQAVLDKCNKDDVEYFEYTHIDGFVVNKPCRETVAITDHYTSIRYQASTRISFGSRDKNTGMTMKGKPSRDEFARTFVVNYIQGLDALVARTVAVKCKGAGIKGFVSIHDCFRTNVEDVSKLMDIIKQTYIELFVDNNPNAHLFKQLGLETSMFKQALTKEMIEQEGAYFFC